jgi:hypothetical protein
MTGSVQYNQPSHPRVAFRIARLPTAWTVQGIDGRDVLHVGRPKLSDLVILVVHLISTSAALFDTRTSVDCRMPICCAGPTRLSFRAPASEH